jgi:hypothetical protein
MNELNQTELLVRLESDNGAHPAKLTIQEGEGVKIYKP